MAGTRREPRSVVHFGLGIQAGKYGLRIDRDVYGQINKRSSTYWRREQHPELWDAVAENYEDEDHRILTDEWCAAHQVRVLRNYDLNMAYFASLDPDEFDQAITAAVAAHRGMVEVTDLNDWERRGVYIMVLDDYRQAYVGVATSDGGIKARIKKHWTVKKPFDRLIWGTETDSILSIDSFRALDTTRIFAAPARDPHKVENKVIESIPGKFLANRIPGGRGDMVGFASALGVNVMKTRELTTELD